MSGASVTGEATATLAARSLTKCYGERTALLDAVSSAFGGTGPGIGWSLVHLAALTLAFGALGRLALTRLAST